ncbi:MAG: fibrobacter succinogenes major paralogous domain-containing protein [Prevotellaceae bacterium]|jgi:hypothetical protein|nr:fibrobacter succinogenes major paralogous domain-containing protein [Prevotellaceae bacterium]
MKKFLTILMFCGVVGGYAQNTPPHAASTKTWTFGEQTWSDAIQIPECNKKSFEESDTEPDCRSYTDAKGNTYYYYNWPYVNTKAARLCPAPWRVPSQADFYILSHAPTADMLVSAWGLSGNAYGNTMHNVGSFGIYWSSTEISSDYAYAQYYISSFGAPPNGTTKQYGLSLRCVR